MHWQEAVNKSNNLIAKRYDVHNDNVYYRYRDGSAIKYLKRNRYPVTVEQREIEGYLDWIPDSPK